jgi:hypothetical protein
VWGRCHITLATAEQQSNWIVSLHQIRVDSFWFSFVWLCEGVRLLTSYSNTFILAERYSYLNLIVIGSASLFNKEQQFSRQFAIAYMIVFHYIFMGFA